MSEDRGLYHTVEDEIEKKESGDIEESPAEVIERRWKKYQEIKSLLPQREVDMLEMSFLYGKDQTSIGHIFNVTQGDVSYRIRRISHRIMYLMSLPEINMEEMRVDLSKILDEEKVIILFLLLKHTSQSKVGEELGMPQGKVRHRYISAMSSIRKESFNDIKYIMYYDLFCKLQGNYNALRTLDVQDRWKHKFDKEEPEFVLD
jgi:DNA-directed RNA polymerase specialized sigma24 family protein